MFMVMVAMVLPMLAVVKENAGDIHQEAEHRDSNRSVVYFLSGTVGKTSFTTSVLLNRT